LCVGQFCRNRENKHSYANKYGWQGNGLKESDYKETQVN
jgi:hypothetical protein